MGPAGAVKLTTSDPPAGILLPAVASVVNPWIPVVSTLVMRTSVVVLEFVSVMCCGAGAAPAQLTLPKSIEPVGKPEICPTVPLPVNVSTVRLPAHVPDGALIATVALTALALRGVKPAVACTAAPGPSVTGPGTPTRDTLGSEGGPKLKVPGALPVFCNWRP